MNQSVREAVSIRALLDFLKKSVSFNEGLVITTVPRGGLQLAQPADLPTGLLKAYSQGFHSEDRLSWQAMLKQKPTAPQDCWKRDELLATPYSRDFLAPLSLAHVVALPLRSPVLSGFPGVVHLCRTAEAGPFTASEVSALATLIKGFDDRGEALRTSRRSGRVAAADNGTSSFPPAELTIVDGKLRPVFGQNKWTAADAQLREQMLEQAKRRTHQLNGHGLLADRVQFPDAQGDVWTFRVVTYRRYPALGDGPFSFFCMQPACGEWSALRAADFQADAELSRLIPSLRYMQQEFAKGPTLVDIAKVAHLSPFHFHRRFTELLGLTPKQFMLECQIHLARTMLLQPDRELVDIAKECGFAHQSHFTSRFRQVTGLTPTRWRRFARDRQKPSTN